MVVLSLDQRMQTLTINNFKVVEYLGLHFYIYEAPKFDIWIEPCFSGFDIAFYSKNKDLLITKECTGRYISRSKGLKSAEKWSRLNKLNLAVGLANKLYLANKQLLEK